MITIQIPGEAVGKGRPKFARRGKFVTTYTPEKTANYENLVKLAAAEAMQGRQLFDSAVHVELLILCSVPQSWSKKKQLQAMSGTLRPTSKPDVDNVQKAIYDALNGIVWADDKQIVSGSFSKHYASAPLVRIRVSPITGDALGAAGVVHE